jgi:16S rRNA (guanine1207-N2)-methyltransferase
MPSQHYFSEQPASSGGRHIIIETIRGIEIRLATEAGVFSRERVDVGTRLLIKQLAIEPSDRILDLGCGYGAVGVVAAKLAPEGQVTLIDINQRAVALAQENLKLNGLTNTQALQGDGFTPVAGQQFDLIALNPPIRAGLRVIHPLLEQAQKHLAPGGRFYLVGRTRQGVIRLAEKMKSVFGQVEEIAKGGGYRVYLSRRSE